MIIVDVQRAGPSTGMPTKTEAADLLAVMYGRHGESPVPIVAPFDTWRMLRRSDRGDPHRGSLSNTCIHSVRHVSRQLVRAVGSFRPSTTFQRSTQTSRWKRTTMTGSCHTCATLTSPVRGPCLAHRASSIVSADSRKRMAPGNISYDPENHERMTRIRAEKIERIADDIPALEVDDPDGADLLVIGWGSTHGAIAAAARRVRCWNGKVAIAHLTHLNPFPEEHRSGRAFLLKGPRSGAKHWPPDHDVESSFPDRRRVLFEKSRVCRF